MSNRIDLSVDTYIETMDGVRYLVTKLKGTAIEWNGAEFHYGFQDPKRWHCTPAMPRFPDKIDQWRILLTAVASVYEYREGEPWAGYVRGVLVCGSSAAYTGYTAAGTLFHRRVTNVCDSTKQFRLLFEELKEARDQ